MKKCMVFIFLTVTLAVLPAQTAPNAEQIAYYKQTAVVDQNKNRSNGDNTGQFIAFTKMGCYDSNKEGYDVGNGFLEYKGLDNNIHVYDGKTYWGQGSYFFNSDFSRLNIRTATGITYVYEKTSAPSGAVTSAKIAQKSAPAANTSPVYTPPPVINPSASGGGSTVNDRIQCNSCKGTGRCTACKGNYESVCNDCNGRGKRVVGYGTNATYDTCVVCNGSGKKYCVICADFRNNRLNYNPGKCGICKGKGYIN